MAVSADIKFTQGPNTAAAGIAVVGTLTDGSVTVTNGDNTNVASWEMELVFVPTDSALATGVFASGVSPTPSGSFGTPDVPGSYRVKLTVRDVGGEYDEDIRVFGVPDFRGRIMPPYQEDPVQIPLSLKENELNFGGQAFGWSGRRDDGLIEYFFDTFEDKFPKIVDSTPFTAEVREANLYLVNTATIGSAVTFDLQSTARTGQVYEIADNEESAGTYNITINLPGGHTFPDASSSASIAQDGGYIKLVRVGATSWVTLSSSVATGGGSVSGPGSSTDRGVATWNGTGGDTLRDNTNVLVTSGGDLKFGSVNTALLSNTDANIVGIDGSGNVLLGSTSVGVQASSTYLSVSAGGAAVADTGILRLPNNQIIYARNQAGSANLALIGTNSSNSILIGSGAAPTTAVYAQTKQQFVIGGNAALEVRDVGTGNLPTSGTLNIRSQGSVAVRNAGDSADFYMVRTDGGNNVYLGYSSTVAGTYIQTAAGGTIGFQIGGTVMTVKDVGTGALSTTGTINLRKGSTIYSRNALDTADYGVLLTDSSDNVFVGSNGASNVYLQTKTNGEIYASPGLQQRLIISQDDATGSAAQAGTFRIASQSTFYIRNAAASADIGWLQFDGSDNMLVGKVGSNRVSSMELDATNGGIFRANGTYILGWTTTTIRPNKGIAFANGATPSITVENATSGDGLDFTLSGQTSTDVNGDGGDLNISAGSGGGTSGIGGSVNIQPGSGFTKGGVQIKSADGTTRIEINAAYSVLLGSGGLLSIGGSSVSVNTVNLSWSSGVSSPMLWQATDVAGSAVGDTLTIHAQDCSGATSTGGALHLRAGTGTSTNGVLELQDSGGTARVTVNASGSVVASGAATVILQAAGGNVIYCDATQASIYKPLITFAATMPSPIIRQNDETANGATGDLLTIYAQDCTGTTSTGGGILIRSGTGTSTVGDVKISAGSTYGVLSYSGGEAILGGAVAAGTRPTNAIMDGASGVYLRTAGTSRLYASSSGVYPNVALLSFAAAVASPVITQETHTGAGTADTLLIHAQDTDAAGSDTGGALHLRPGNGTLDGELVIQAADGTAVLSTVTGNIALRVGPQTSDLPTSGILRFQNDQVMIAQYGDGGDAHILYGVDGDTYLGGTQSGNLGVFIVANTGSPITHTIGATPILTVTSTAVTVSVQNLTFANSVTAPKISQASIGTGTTSQDLYIEAQSNTNTSSTGGDVFISPGSGTSAGGYVYITDSDTNSIISTASTTSGTDTVYLGIRYLILDDLTNDVYVTMKPEGSSTSSRTLTVTGQTNSVSTGMGGDVYIQGGDGNNATTGNGGDVIIKGGGKGGDGVQGNVGINGDPASWESMQRGIFVSNCTSAPSSNPAAGGFLFADSGAGKWRGTSGTVTTFGPAEPHCPTCGRDFALEWESDKYGRLAICAWCLTDALGNQGVITKQPA